MREPASTRTLPTLLTDYRRFLHALFMGLAPQPLIARLSLKCPWDPPHSALPGATFLDHPGGAPCVGCCPAQGAGLSGARRRRSLRIVPIQGESTRPAQSPARPGPARPGVPRCGGDGGRQPGGGIAPAGRRAGRRAGAARRAAPTASAKTREKIAPPPSRAGSALTRMSATGECGRAARGGLAGPLLGRQRCLLGRARQ
jgi:hypothetical protein